VAGVARHGRDAGLDPAALPGIRAARDLVRRTLSGGQAVYGINTGFGELKNVRVSAGDVRDLQRNLVRSHSSGVGAPLPRDVVRAMILLRAHSVARGNSGVREEVIETLLTALHRGFHPVVPSRGSVGASGDLIPLAHLALGFLGEGEAELDGEVLPAREALRRASIEPLVLEAKEGLALVNGTQAMTAVGSLLVEDAASVLGAALSAAAMALDALQGSVVPFDPRFQNLRPHPGAVRVAEEMRRRLRGSAIHASHRDCDRLQDAYTLRTIAPVLGASVDALAYAAGALHVERNAVTDNPLCFPGEGEILSGGNFHGQPVALPLDVAAIALATVATMSERRTYRLTDSRLSGLPPFLTRRAGIESGYMLPQYAAAALVNENRILSAPASVDSIPTSAGMEDHVSMGMTAALKARTVLENTARVVAIELLTAAEALEFARPLRSSEPVEEAHARVRERAPALTGDRPLGGDIERVAAAVLEGAFGRLPLDPEEEGGKDAWNA
jgi:histidine ammonia-lyase